MTNNESHLMAAELLRVSANAYAAYASNLLLERLPRIKSQFGENAFADWRDFYAQRINELSVAMAETEPALFSSRVRWSRAAFKARELTEELLRESLLCLEEVLEQELPEEHRQAPKKYISVAMGTLKEPETESEELDSGDPIAKLAMQYLLEVLEGNSNSAIRLVMDARQNGMSLESTYQVLMAAQREVGRMWHQADVNIAEEHMVTSTTRRAMSVLAYHAERTASNGLTVVSAAVAGNTHDIGVRMISDFFEFAGWRVICLGADLPAAEIAEAVRFFDPSLVLLSVALSTQLPAARMTIEAVRETGSECKIMIGGSALADAPDIWKQLGADACATSPAEALSLGAQLAGQA
jgi:MerR family transcriptional regulator, light-induced transcriptional regulator